MPKGTNQKLKLYYLSKIMLEKTDEEHALTMPQIQEELAAYGVTADRKSLYDDIKALEVLGIDVLLERDGKNYKYHVASKQFEIAELKLLVDSIQSSKFITEKKSNALIKKLTSFASIYEESQLKRQVVVQGRIKTMNESIYYIVDEIHYAITNNKKVRFEYMQWNLKKEMVPRKEGLYEVSPWALTFDDENYYLVAYDSGAQKIKHYRVDKMRKLEITDDKREGRKEFDAVDMAAYSRMNFGMFGGTCENVKLRFKNEMVGVILDRFGKDINIKETSEPGWAETNVEVIVSDQFFGWIFALGTDVKIAEPVEVRDKFKKELKELVDAYE